VSYPEIYHKTTEEGQERSISVCRLLDEGGLVFLAVSDGKLYQRGSAIVQDVVKTGFELGYEGGETVSEVNFSP
jgi:hypothetical protein